MLKGVEVGWIYYSSYLGGTATYMLEDTGSVSIAVLILSLLGLVSITRRRWTPGTRLGVFV